MGSGTWLQAATQWESHGWVVTLRGDELADVRCRGRLVARSVRLVVRDRDWNAVPLEVGSVTASEGRLEIAVRTVACGANMTGRVTVRTSALDDRPTARIEACVLSRSRFETNRTGLVVLHPPRLAGTTLTVTTEQGAHETAFPEAISPHQIASGITGLGWTDGGLQVGMVFEGDVFEMEDQRNWTDASYKTYSRPLSQGFPYPLPAGSAVRQALRLTAESVGSAEVEPPDVCRAADRLVLGNPAVFPSLGVAASTAPELRARPGKGAVDPAWATTLVELDLGASTWRAALARAASSGRPLDARIVVGQGDDRALADAVMALSRHPVERLTAFWSDGEAKLVADERLTSLLVDATRRAGIRVRVCSGVRSQFAELNREHHRFPRDADGIVVSVSPFVHGSDTAQMVESVAVQRMVALQAVRIADGRDVHIGPISLRPHVNAVATTPEPRASRTDLMDGYGPALLDATDERQGWPLTGAWTAASAAAMTVSGVTSLTYFEEWGPRGVRTEGGTPLPVLDALAALARWQGAHVATGASDDGLLWVIADTGGSRVLAANLDAVEREVQLELGSQVLDSELSSLRLAPGSWSEAGGTGGKSVPAS